MENNENNNIKTDIQTLKQQAEEWGNDFFANMTTLTFRYLLNGELTKAKKDTFCEKAFAYIDRLS